MIDGATGRAGTAPERVDHYGAQYTNFATALYEEIRREVFGEDIGQNGWLTAHEQDLFVSWLELNDACRLLDVACGSGGPALRIASMTGCEVNGVDIHEHAVSTATAAAARRELAERVRFQRADASDRLPFPDATFDALTCIDAINHLADRAGVLRDWARVLKPGGRLVFTDPIVVTGLLTNREIAVRSSIGYFLFAAPGVDVRLLEEAGFEVRAEEDRTPNMARIAERWRAARQVRESSLRPIEGDHTFDGQQEFFRVASAVADERRLSRFAYLAVKRP